MRANGLSMRWMHSHRSLAVVLISALILGYASFASAQAAVTVTFTLASDSTWKVFDADPAAGGSAILFGPAQIVCLNTTLPSGHCDGGGVSYGYPGNGWFADLSSIPQAAWVWGPGTTGATYPADLKDFFFVKELEVPGIPTAGIISIAADDFAELIVNGHVVGHVGSTIDISLAGQAQAQLTTWDITPFLGPGTNIITIHGQNGPGSFAGCASCSYAQNPAGVVFGGTVNFYPGLGQ